MLRPFARRLILHEAIRSGQSCTEEIQNENTFSTIVPKFLPLSFYFTIEM